MQYDKELDVRGLACPSPIVQTRKALASLEPGQVLRVVATDPGATSDMQAFSEQTGHALLSSTSESGVLVFHLRK